MTGPHSPNDETASEEDEQPSDDPGWPSLGATLFVMIPVIGLRRVLRRRNDPIMPIRMLFLAFSNSILLFALVLATLGGRPSGPVLPWVPILAVIAGASAVACRRFLAEPLDCTSSQKLVESYRTRLFLLIVFCESVALFSFLASFVGGPSWIYYVGGEFAYVQLWVVAAPTRRRFTRDEERLAARGCDVSLLAALRGSPPAAPPPTPPPPVPRYPPPPSDL